jgi:TetR/AcrR family tetracycline transcriptional repressor
VTRERLVPGTLSRDRIIEVALDLAKREGIESLSMRRIAAELGTGAMSLYNHVPDKAALLKGLADRVLDEVEIPERGSWREAVESWATSLHGTLLAHRHVVAIVISANEAQPLVAVTAALVAALVRAQLAEEDARDVVRAVGRFVAGSVVLDAAYLRWGRADHAPLDQYFAYGLGSLLDGLERRVDAPPAPRPGDATAPRRPAPG